MWFKKRRDRRIAEVRRQLSELDAVQASAHEPPQKTGHLIGAGTWLVAMQLRRPAPTRSDYLFGPLFRGTPARKSRR
jgi:hypothetical protein